MLIDLLTLQDKLVTIENIQKTVADYYKSPVSDLLANSRLRTLSRPRQLAMTLTKELTTFSLPEIGEALSLIHITHQRMTKLRFSPSVVSTEERVWTTPCGRLARHAWNTNYPNTS